MNGIRSFFFKLHRVKRPRLEEGLRLSFLKGVGFHLRSRFTIGLVLLVPILFTYFILQVFFSFLDGFLAPIFHQYGVRFPGLGLIALLGIIYLSGVIGTNLVGHRIFTALQQVLLRIPIVRTVYGLGKQITDAFSGHTPTGLNRVVITEYLRPGMWTIGFLNGFTTTEDGVLNAVLYIPTAPLPNSGWLVLAPVGQVYDTNLSPQTAMQMVLSGGMIYPDHLERHPLPEATAGVVTLQRGKS